MHLVEEGPLGNQQSVEYINLQVISTMQSSWDILLLLTSWQIDAASCSLWWMVNQGASEQSISCACVTHGLIVTAVSDTCQKAPIWNSIAFYSSVILFCHRTNPLMTHSLKQQSYACCAKTHLACQMQNHYIRKSGRPCFFQLGLTTWWTPETWCSMHR